MATYEEVINGNINSLKQLKDLIKAFKDELATAKEGSEEWENAVEGLSVAQERLDKINKAAKGTLEGYNNSAKDSINTLKARIKELNTERNAMDMNSAEYAEATAQLKEMNDRLRESGVAAGDMKANVGNYAQSLAAGFNGVKDAVGQASSQMISAIGGLGQSLGALSPTVSTVTTGFKGLTAATGPVGVALAAVAAVLAAFKQGVESSETNTNKFKEAIAPLQAIFVLIERAIQKATGKVLDWMIALRKNEKVMKTVKTAATVIVTTLKTLHDIISGLVTGFEKLYNKLKEFGQKAAKFFEPVTKAVTSLAQKVKPVVDKLVEATGIKKNYQEAKESVEEFGKAVETETEKIIKINKEEAALQQSKRGILLSIAELNGQIAQKELEINEERNKEIKDYDKILGLINEKTELNVKLAEENVALKSAEYNIIRQRNALSDSNTKDLDAEAQALAAVKEAQNQVTLARARGEQEKKRETQAKLNQELTIATNAYTAALKNYEAQYNSVLATIEKPIAPEGSEIDKDSINAYHDQIMENYRIEWEAYSAMTEGKIAAEQALMAERQRLGKDTTVQEANIAKLRADNAKKYKDMINAQNKDDKDRLKSLRANYQSQLGAFSNLMGSMSSLFEENTVAYKATATAKALLDTYMAANAVLAQQTGGYIARAAAMAATIATGIANVIAIWKTDTKNPSVSTSTQAAATTVPTVDETPYSYAQTVQTVASEEVINREQNAMKVYVLESDITSAQEKARVRVAESSF